jgi:hypothetical protein
MYVYINVYFYARNTYMYIKGLQKLSPVSCRSKNTQTRPNNNMAKRHKRSGNIMHNHDTADKKIILIIFNQVEFTTYI